MRQILAAILLTACASLSQQAAAQAPQSDFQPPTQDASTHEKPAIIVPAGTKVALTLTSPIWARSANVGDTIHSATSFPVAIGNEMAIPPGTYVEGKIDALRPRAGSRITPSFNCTLQSWFSQMATPSSFL